jgi:colanic acid/amylovoran biosynthesis glycosyltransferase
MKIGYLMNSYPMTSTTFIRGEIEALESMNVEIKRYAVRRWGERLVDPRDIAEGDRTQYLLSGNMSSLIFVAFIELFTNVRGIIRTIGPWIHQIRHSDGNFVKHMAYLLEAIVLRRRAKRDGVRHLHVHFSTNSTAVAMLAKFLGGPSYSFTAHGPDEFSDFASGSLQMKIRHSEFVVAISHFCKVQLISASGMEFWDKVHIVRCGVEVEALAPSTQPFDGNEVLVCVGRLCLQKGQLLLPKAVAALRSEFPGLKLVLIGDGPIRHALEDSIRSHGVSDMFELRGWQPNAAVRETVRHARAFLLPSFAEGLPVVIMEALALGRPVISTYIAGIPELVDSDCGWLVPSGSECDLLNAMREALRADSQRLEKLGLEGRRRVKDRHDQHKNARRLQELFQAT